MSEQAVLDALTEQVECCRRLAKLSRIQHEHISHGRVEQLLDVLQSRQDVLAQMSACETLLAPARQRWNEFLDELDPADRARADSLLSESRELLETITSADRDDALVLQQRKLNLGREIRQTGAARQINRMYGVAAYGSRPPRMDIQR